jgi:hypothetical protein
LSVIYFILLLNLFISHKYDSALSVWPMAIYPIIVVQREKIALNVLLTIILIPVKLLILSYLLIIFPVLLTVPNI